MLTTLRFNLANTAIRHETLHGKRFVVAPMAMLTEGVHNGSGGPLLYKADEIKRAVPGWNMKPIVVYHPQINGQGVSACDPDILESQQVGMVMNAKWNGKLRAEAWIDEARAGLVDGRVLEALEANKLMEVSTGLFTDNVTDPGEWNGKPYDAVATNHQPDHLALLPDQIGACSVADGAGLLQLNETAKAAGVDVGGLLARQMDVMRRMVGNAMSHANIYAALTSVLTERFKPGVDKHVWVVDVYDDFVVYEIEGDGKQTLYRLAYTTGKEGVALATGEPDEVVRVTEYRATTGEFVGNEARTTIEEPNMDKEKIVDGLIANTQTAWGEDDRETLMDMDEAVLNKLAPVVVEPEPVVAAPVANTEGAPVAEVQTAKQYIDDAPPEIRELLTNGLAAHEAAKGELIDAIVANKSNKFTKEFLATKGLQELQGLAALATAGGEDHNAGNPTMFYGGAATPASAPVVNAEDEEALPLPTINFGKEPQTATA